MRTYSVEGIVLSRADFGETDRILTIFTREKGKITAAAKGIRKITSRRASSLEPLNYSRILLSKGANLDTITQTQILHSFKNIPSNLEKIAYSFQISELVGSFFGEEQPSKRAFELLLTTLNKLDRQKDPERTKIILRGFELKLLFSVGFGPFLQACVLCKKILRKETNFFSADLGGIIHKNCSYESYLTLPVSVNALKVLRFLQKKPFSEIEKLVLEERIKDEVERILKFYIEYLLENELRSADFIKKIKTLKKRGSVN